MNPFYRRLITFGRLVQQLSRKNKTNYNDYFEIEHPGLVAISKPQKVKPTLSFKQPCSKKDRNQIIQLFKICFDARKYA